MFVNQPLDEIAEPRRRPAGSRTCSCTATRARRSARPSPSARAPKCDQGGADRPRRGPVATWSATTPTSICWTLRGGAVRRHRRLATGSWSPPAQQDPADPLTGGLTSENVGDGPSRALRPWGVDVGERRRGVARGQGSREARGVHAAVEAVEASAGRGDGISRTARQGGVSAVEHRFGPYGGQYVPETLIPALDELEAAWIVARDDPAFQGELTALLTTTSAARRRSTWPQRVCRRRRSRRSISSARTWPTPARTRSTTRSARRCSRSAWARRGSSPRPARASTASRPRPPARCSASSASSTWATEDMRRQALNVFRMKLLGAEVVAGRRGRADAQGRHQRGDPRLGHQRRHHALLIGSVRRPAPVPDDRARLPVGHRRRGARADPRAQDGRLPDRVVACVGGGSNAIGTFLRLPRRRRRRDRRRRGGGRGARLRARTPRR